MKLSKLKGKLAENNMTNSAMAKAIGISQTSFSHKITGKRQFLAGEIVAIKNLLRLTNDELAAILSDDG